MPNLVVCCDGTWNTPDDVEGGVPAPTNVRKLFNALGKDDEGGTPQQTYYHPGVGTEGGLRDHLLGGSIGEGLDRNIKSAYQWLAFNYRHGDNIFLFGFSRGAFTVRSLTGMIERAGLLNIAEPKLASDEAWKRIDLAFDCYRNRKLTDEYRGFAFHEGAPQGDAARNIPIHFIGVWDTVGALGIPDDLALLNLLDKNADHRFHDTSLCPSVAHARHAVAMDERRQSFAPTLWEGYDRTRDVKQIWFPGVHSNVGGGYGLAGLSDGALLWMIEEAAGCGLAFRTEAKGQIRPDPLAMLHDSLSGVFKFLKCMPRAVPEFDKENRAKLFHDSAIQRHQNPPISQGEYWPTSILEREEKKVIDIFARQLWNSTGIFLREGRYRLTASGEWMDGRIPCGPDGMDDGKFHLGEVAHLIGSAMGKAEQVYKGLTGNKHADYWGSKRIEEAPWFSLIGVVANGQGVGQDGQLADHLTFTIGSGRELEIAPDQEGYLFAFANDAWQAYVNNKGNVALMVRRIS
jgi:hypothetical protein